jgi:hypothetical protein
MDVADQPTHGLFVRGLLLCGAASSILYPIIDLIGAVNYPGYDYSAQAISEMSATGAPTASLLVPWYSLWSILFLAFTLGVWIVGRTRRPLRWCAALLLAVAIVGFGFSLFPMSQRSAVPTFSDTMHLVVAGAIMLLLSAAILTGARAFDGSFGIHSATTVIVMLLFFIATLRDVPNVAADLPTPYMGLSERISMAAWLLWIALFSVKLLRTSTPRTPSKI